MAIVGLDVAHRRGDVRMIQQILGEVDIPLRLLHQVGRERVSEAVWRHPHSKLVDQLFVHRLDLV